jgi:hypothetical protein
MLALGTEGGGPHHIYIYARLPYMGARDLFKEASGFDFIKYSIELISFLHTYF